MIWNIIVSDGTDPPLDFISYSSIHPHSPAFKIYTIVYMLTDRCRNACKTNNESSNVIIYPVENVCWSRLLFHSLFSSFFPRRKILCPHKVNMAVFTYVNSYISVSSTLLSNSRCTGVISHTLRCTQVWMLDLLIMPLIYNRATQKPVLKFEIAN